MDQLLKFVTSGPRSRAWTGPFSARTYPNIAIPTDDFFGEEEFKHVPVPQSGMDRAAWFEHNRVKTERDKFVFTDFLGNSIMGANERMVYGAMRDQFAGGIMTRAPNQFLEVDPITANSDTVPRIWSTEVAATGGLWDNPEVYVSQDEVTVWA